MTDTSAFLEDDGMPATLRDLTGQTSFGLRPVHAVDAATLDRPLLWAHSSDLPDPTPWLGTDGLLLTDGVNVSADDLAALTEGFSPADIEFAARSASQRAFETAVRSAGDGDVRDLLGLEQYRCAIAETTPTISPTVTDEFEADILAFART